MLQDSKDMDKIGILLTVHAFVGYRLQPDT